MISEQPSLSLVCSTNCNKDCVSYCALLYGYSSSNSQYKLQIMPSIQITNNAYMKEKVLRLITDYFLWLDLFSILILLMEAQK